MWRPLCAAPRLRPHPSPQGNDGAQAPNGTSTHPSCPLSPSFRPLQVPPSSPGPGPTPSGFPVAPRNRPKTSQQAELHPIPNFAVSAVPRPGPGAEMGSRGGGGGMTDGLRRGPGPHTHHPSAESHLLLLLLPVPPPLPGATVVAPPPTSPARTAAELSNRTRGFQRRRARSAQARRGSRPLRRPAPGTAGGSERVKTRPRGRRAARPVIGREGAAWGRGEGRFPGGV